jgi:hypothetical protein
MGLADGRRTPRRVWLVGMITRMVFMPLPLLFLLAPAGLVLKDALSGVDVAFVELLGERAGRGAFCGLWLALNAAVLWGLVGSKHRHSPTGDR